MISDWSLADRGRDAERARAREKVVSGKKKRETKCVTQEDAYEGAQKHIDRNRQRQKREVNRKI